MTASRYNDPLSPGSEAAQTIKGQTAGKPSLKEKRKSDATPGGDESLACHE